MVKDAYDMFFKNISMQFHDDSLVNALVEDAEELAKYGEKRVALENFLENVLANEVTISKEAVTLAEKAFSETYQSSRQSSNHVKVHSGNAVRNYKSVMGKAFGQLIRCCRLRRIHRSMVPMCSGMREIASFWAVRMFI